MTHSQFSPAKVKIKWKLHERKAPAITLEQSPCFKKPHVYNHRLYLWKDASRLRNDRDCHLQCAVHPWPSNLSTSPIVTILQPMQISSTQHKSRRHQAAVPRVLFSNFNSKTGLEPFLLSFVLHIALLRLYNIHVDCILCTAMQFWVHFGIQRTPNRICLIPHD